MRRAAENEANGRAVFARHAASLLLVRQSAAGAEVLMGVRGVGHRFLPNQLVFPGGAVDAADRHLAAATEPRPDVLLALQAGGRAPLARGLAMAAARELREETGVSLGDPPRLDVLDYLCRAVTPKRSPIRFNARFLVAPAEAAEGEPASSHELVDVRFIAVEAALRLDLMLVTREVLGQLEAWLQRDEAGRAAWPRRAFIERGWRTD